MFGRQNVEVQFTETIELYNGDVATGSGIEIILTPTIDCTITKPAIVLAKMP